MITAAKNSFCDLGRVRPTSLLVPCVTVMGRSGVVLCYYALPTRYIFRRAELPPNSVYLRHVDFQAVFLASKSTLPIAD